MIFPNVRERIRRVKQYESKNGEIAVFLEQRLEQLHSSVQLPRHHEVDTLRQFMLGYIEQSSEMLKACRAVAEAAGIDGQIGPVLQMAEDLLLQDVKADGQGALLELLQNAYFSHRLVEEINDLYILYFGRPLVPLDATSANLIAYQLIGETVAGLLDESVRKTLDEMLDRSIFDQHSAQAFRERLGNPDILALWSRWPALSEQLGVTLQWDRGLHGELEACTSKINGKHL